MKKVVSGKLLREKMKEAIDLLCDTVKLTLGPRGRNVIIDHSDFSPFITNDGVTIAKNIESDDAVIGAILELAKEASIKTDETVGDGTTTTLVLLQAIFNAGLELINQGINPILIKKSLDKWVEKLIIKIKEKRIVPTEEQLRSIAITSANSTILGNLVADAFFKVKDKDAIIINEVENEKHSLVVDKGYKFETLIASPYFLKDSDEINCNDTLLMVLNFILSDLEDINEAIKLLLETKKSLIIVAEDYSDDFINDVLALNYQEKLQIILLKSPEYGIRNIEVMQDLAIISNSEVFNSLDELITSNFGRVQQVKIDKNYTTFYFKENARILSWVSLLKNSDQDEFIKKRIAMFENGIAIINVGALTSVERREEKMRVEDAVWAISKASNGVCIGSGLVLYEVSENIIEDELGSNILKEAFKEPLKQVMYNAGLDYKEIINEIKNADYKKLFNLNIESYEDINSTSVLDSLEVIISSLKTSCSIAGMLLTTPSIVINEVREKSNYDEYG